MRATKTATQGNADLRQEPACDRRTDDADNNIPDQAKSGTLDNLTGKPAGDCSYDDQLLQNPSISPIQLCGLKIKCPHPRRFRAR
jgi:hypothetical protein